MDNFRYPRKTNYDKGSIVLKEETISYLWLTKEEFLSLLNQRSVF